MTEILPNSPNDVASRGVTNTTLAQFKGLARQVVINIDDGFRPVIMDGLTLGGKFFCASKAEVEAVKVTAQGALTKTQADGYYLGKNNPTFTGTLSGTSGTFTGTLSGTSGTFTGTLSLKGNSVATQSELLTKVTSLSQELIDHVLTVLGIYQALEELITENGGTVPTSLSTNSVQTMSEDEADPWADLE